MPREGRLAEAPHILTLKTKPFEDIGYAKVENLEQFVGETVMQLMRDVKMAFDPKGLLNPGKVCGKK